MALNPTNFPTPLNSTCKLLLGDGTGYAVLASCTSTPPTTADVFQHGCIMAQTDTATSSQALYQNIGSVAVPSWSLLDTASASFTLPAAATDATTTTGNSFALTQNAVTTGKAIVTTVNGLTTGKGIEVTHTTSVIASGGTLLNLSSTGIDTATTSGALVNLTSTASTAGTQTLLTASGLTTGIAASIVVAGLTSGIGHKVAATAATLTTGRYYSANDAATEVFGIGANGHIHSTVSAAPPTIAVTQQNGITAAAITAGGSDTCGVITTTGTNNNGGTSILQVTFGKTYTTAPKGVLLFPANSAATKAAATSLLLPYVSATSATTFDITIPADASAAATPSWRYVVIG